MGSFDLHRGAVADRKLACLEYRAFNVSAAKYLGEYWGAVMLTYAL